MANRLRKVPTVTYRPGTPGVPPTPAYCTLTPVFSDYGAYVDTMRMVVRLTEQANKQKVGSSYFGQIGQDQFGRPVYGLKSVNITDFARVFFGPASGDAVPLVLGYTQVCYPAIAGVPSTPPTSTYNAQTGWNSGGLSIGGFAGDGYAEFSIGPSSIGVVVGISTGPDTNNPTDCSHAFYGANGDLYVFETGAIVHTILDGMAGTPRLRIDRSNAQVTYYVDDALVYTSLVGSAGYARIDASLYVAGDYVDSPAIGAIQRSAAQTNVGVTAFIDPRARASTSVGVTATALGRAGSTYVSKATTRVGVMAAAGGYATNQLAATTSIGVVATAAQGANRVSARVPQPLVLAADADYGFVESAYTGGYQSESAGGYPTVVFSGAFALAPQFAAFSYGASGGLADVSATGPIADVVAADYPYAQVVANYTGGYFSQSYEPWLAADAIELREALLVSTEFQPFVAIHATFSSVVEVEDEMVIELEVTEGFEWLDALMVTASFAELSDKTAEMSEVVYVTDQTQDGGASARQIASNTVTAAATTYSGFDFLSLHHLGRAGTYAVRADGIYRVTGGGLVSAIVDTGRMMFGGYAPKRLEAIYIGMRTDGEVIAVVQAEDETERTYRVIQRPDYMRVSPAKGDSSKTWRLRLELTEAAEGDMDIIQFVVSEQPRRWSR